MVKDEKIKSIALDDVNLDFKIMKYLLIVFKNLSQNIICSIKFCFHKYFVHINKMLSRLCQRCSTARGLVGVKVCNRQTDKFFDSIC